MNTSAAQELGVIRRDLAKTKNDLCEERDALEKIKEELRKTRATLAKTQRKEYDYPGAWWSKEVQVRQSCMRALCDACACRCRYPQERGCGLSTNASNDRTRSCAVISAFV